MELCLNFIKNPNVLHIRNFSGNYWEIYSHKSFEFYNTYMYVMYLNNSVCLFMDCVRA